MNEVLIERNDKYKVFSISCRKDFLFAYEIDVEIGKHDSHIGFMMTNSG